MKKNVIFAIAFGLFIGLFSSSNTFATTIKTIIPKAPVVSASLKPIIAKYKQQNYVSAMQDLEDLTKKEPNNTLAMYYLALCYTQLGFPEKAQSAYKLVLSKSNNGVLTYYSQKAINCLDNPSGEMCVAKTEKTEETEEVLDEMSKFIESGQRIHPYAMDKITTERMERKRQEQEYLRNHPNTNLKTDASQPSAQEVIAALNVLAKVGLNPYQQDNTKNNLLSLFNPNNQFDYFGNFQSTNNIYPDGMNSLNRNNLNMLMINQMLQEQNMLGYGI